MSELTITKLSHCSAPVTGGSEVILLCDRVTKDDVQVRFYEERNGRLVWEAFGDFQPNDVHKQVAICFRTPRYIDDSIQQSVTVQLQLRRPSDMQTSECRPFQFMPREVDPNGLSRKRQKLEEGPLDRYLIDNGLLQPPGMPQAQGPLIVDQPDAGIAAQDFIRVPRFSQKVKHELQDDHQSATTHTGWVFPPQDKGKNEVFGFNPNIAFGVPSDEPQELQHKLNIKQEPELVASGGMRHPNNLAAEALTAHLDSLDLDIDPSDLINDINFNNLMVMMDSGNNITFNSSGNITTDPLPSGTLNTPHILDISDNNRQHHPLSQMNRLQPDMQFNLGSKHSKSDQQ